MRFERIAGAALVISALMLNTADARHYEIVPAESSVRIHVGTKGLLKRFGHDHDVFARAFTGSVDVEQAHPADGHVTAMFESKSLDIVPGSESSKDAPKVRKTMLGPKVLDSERYPQITVTSRQITATPIRPGVFDLQLSGDLALHGVVRPIRVPLRVELTADRLVARGSTTIRQTDFGISPVSVAGGTIKAKNDVTIQLVLVGRAAGN